MALTPKQNLFIDGLLDGKTKRQAYIDAGYSTAGKSNKYIDTRASELYNNSEVLGKYTELVDKLHDRTLWTREQAIKDYIEVKEMALQDMRENGIRHATQQAFNSTASNLNKLVFEDDIRIRKQELEIKILQEKLKLLKTDDRDLSPQERWMQQFIESVHIALERDDLIDN